MNQLSTVFKALSDPLRLRILRLLLQNGREAYGEELATALRIPAYQLSRHLKVLKTTGLINERREGRWVYYSLDKEHQALLRPLRQLLTHPNGSRAHRNGGRAGTKREPTRRREPDLASWDSGPAIAGIL